MHNKIGVNDSMINPKEKDIAPTTTAVVKNVVPMALSFYLISLLNFVFTKIIILFYFIFDLDMLEEIAKTKQVLFHIRDEKGKTPLYFAASKGYLEGVQFLLHYSRQSTLERSTKGDFPIHAACKNGHVNVVNVLLEKQWPDPTELLNKEGQNILHVAAKSGKDVVVKNILRNPKLDEKLLNAKDNDGNTALHLASMNLHPKVVVSLTWDKRIDLKLTNMEGLTALDVLADCGSIPPTTLTEVWLL